MRPSKFGVNWPFGSGEAAKNRFSKWPHGGHLGFPIGTILVTFDLQVTLMLPSKFGVNWPFDWEKKRKIDFQDGGHGGQLDFRSARF